MNLVLFWKEIREQFGILVALAVMGTGIIVSAATLGSLSSDFSPFEIQGYAQPARLAAIVLVAVSGLVIGGMLFAGEHENGTAEFFLHLPTSRSRLWIGKLISGAVLAFVMSFAFWGASASVGMFAWRQLVGWWMWMIVIGMSSFSAGAFGSSMARQVLPACGIGIAAGPIVSGISLLCTSLAYQYSISQSGDIYRSGRTIELILAASPLASMVVFSILSYALFTRPDRMRRQLILSDGAIKSTIHGIRTARMPGSRFGIRALFWFVRRTWLMYAIVLHSISLISGLVLLFPDVPVVLVWPFLTLILGTLAGVFCFASEQLNGVHRFWAERALPPGRMWFAKVIVGLGVLLTCLIVTLIPIILLTLAQGRHQEYGQGFAAFVLQMFRTKLFLSGFPYAFGLFLWPLYGFAAGLLSGMCFQKPLVSCAVGMMTAAMVSVLWIPSIMSGGLSGWQVWPAPFVVILCSRWLIRDWALDRIVKGRGRIKLALAIVLPMVLIAGGLAFRAFEVPTCPEIDDDIRFSKQLPTTDDQQPGRVIKRAIGQFVSEHEAVKEMASVSFFGNAITRRNLLLNMNSRLAKIGNQIGYSLQVGYPTDRPDFDFYLDRLFASKDWLEEWKKILNRPPGVFIDPNDVALFTYAMEFDQFMTMATSLQVRILQQQARGNPDVGVDHFDLLLTSLQTLRHQTIYSSLHYCSVLENSTNLTIARWLERLDHNPALLKKLLAVLRKHERAPSENPGDYLLAQQVVLRNAINDPQRWYAKRNYVASDLERERLEAEANLLQFCWNVPWEKERMHRVIGLYNSPDPPAGLVDRFAADVKRLVTGSSSAKVREPEAYVEGMPVAFLFGSNRGIDAFQITKMDDRRFAELRGTMLVVALRLFEAERGELPESLDELVPQYLPSIPVDPYSSAKATYHYERSPGRTVYLKHREYWDQAPPGMTENGMLPRDRFSAVIAAAGGSVGFPLANRPWSLMTNMPGVEINIETMETVMALTGALPAAVHECPFPDVDGSDRESPDAGPGSAMSPIGGMPGGSAAMSGSSQNLIAPVVIAGIGGPGAASIKWNDEMRLRFFNPNEFLLNDMESQFIPKGRGIVWSVGENGIDNGGIFNDTRSGDLIFVVPPAVAWQPIKGGPSQ